MIKGTVALPVYNSQQILWLCLESLCRQNPPVNEWELIVFEERHATQCGDQYIRKYLERLQAIGCKKYTYLTSTDRISLPQKWARIARKAHEDSEYFCLCAADNFYHPWLLVDSEQAVKKCDWFITTKGYFYDLRLKKMILYDYRGRIGLQMTASTPLTRDLPTATLSRGVDGWFFKNLKPKKIILDPSDHWEKTLWTNGCNNISKARHKFFINPRSVYKPTNQILNNVVPDDIYNMIINLSNNLK